MNKRELRLEKYGINKKRYLELRAFCEQYPYWKKELANHTYVGGINYSNEKSAPTNAISDKTCKDAIKLCRYQKNCDLIERVAKSADAEFWQFLIDSICYEVPLTYLMSVKNMPLEKTAFYDRRRYFFYLLDSAKDTEK